MTAAKLGISFMSANPRWCASLRGSAIPAIRRCRRSSRRGVTSRLNAVDRMGIRYAGRSQSEVIESVLTGDMDNIRATMETLDAAAFDAGGGYPAEREDGLLLGIRSCAPLAEFLGFYLNMVPRRDRAFKNRQPERGV